VGKYHQNIRIVSSKFKSSVLAKTPFLINKKNLWKCLLHLTSLNQYYELDPDLRQKGIYKITEMKENIFYISTSCQNL